MGKKSRAAAGSQEENTGAAAAPVSATDSPDDVRFAALMGELRKKFPDAVQTGEEYVMPWVLRRLPTRIPELDIALNGGLPAGGMTMVYGSTSVGKNWLANRVIANQQRLYGPKCRIGIISTELVYDKGFLHMAGGYVPYAEEEIAAMVRAHKEIMGTEPSPAVLARWRQKVGEVMLCPPSSLAENSLELACEWADSGLFNVILIDSFGSLLTADDDEKKLEDNPRLGGAAGLNTRFSRKMNSALGPKKGVPNLTCVIGINQVRANTKPANPNSPTTLEAGGYALQHGRWVTIELKRIGQIKKKVPGTDIEAVVGKTIRWSIPKQKAGGHEGHEGSYEFFTGLDTGVDMARELLKAGVHRGLVSKRGSYYEYEGVVLGNSLDAAAAAANASDWLHILEKELLKSAGVVFNT